MVTAGLANDVEDVETNIRTDDVRGHRERRNVFPESDTSPDDEEQPKRREELRDAIAGPVRARCEITQMAGRPNIRCALATPAAAPKTCALM